MVLSKYKKFIFFFVICVGLGFGIWGIAQWRQTREALRALNTPERQQMYEKAINYEKKIKENPENFEYYNAAGFNWKSLGDDTRKEYFYRRALAVDAQAFKYEKAKSALFYLNSGNIYRTLGEFENADRQYLQAIALNTGDDVMHRARIDLYVAWGKKTPEEVLAVFDNATQQLLFAVNVNLEKAAYLTKLGRYSDALRIYEGVKVGYPNQPGINEKIAELNTLISVQTKK